jgi:hypothetical protein
VDTEWENRSLRRKKSTAKVPDPAADAALMVQLSDVTIYIFAGTVLGR